MSLWVLLAGGTWINCISSPTKPWTVYHILVFWMFYLLVWEEEITSVSTNIPLSFTVGIFFYTFVFRHKDGAPSRFPVLVCGPDPHLWPWQISCDILFRTAVRKEVFLLCRWTAELFSWVATEKHDKSKWMQKNGEETVAGRSQFNLWAPVASSKEIYTLLQKRGGRVNAAAEYSWSAGESSAAMEIMRMAPAVPSLSHTLWGHCWRPAGAHCSGDAAGEV